MNVAAFPHLVHVQTQPSTSFSEILIGNEAVLEFLSTAEEGQLTAPRRLQNALWLSASQNHPGSLDSWASVVVTTQR